MPKRKKQKKKPRAWLWRCLRISAYTLILISALPMLYIRFFSPPSSSFIEINKWKANTNIQREWVDINEVSLYLPLAILAAEDQTFPTHFGFDIAQIKLAIKEGKTAKTRGASTISQQLVKNLFLWPERSYLRKSIEAWLTLWMEIIVPKKRILELYINYAQFGTSIFGVQAASKYYFSVPASALTPHQSALLAAILPTPARSTPRNPSQSLLLRAEIIKDQMPRIGGRKIIREL